MPILSKVATDHWKAPFLKGTVLYNDDTFMITVNPDLEGNECVRLALRCMALAKAVGVVLFARWDMLSAECVM